MGDRSVRDGPRCSTASWNRINLLTQADKDALATRGDSDIYPDHVIGHALTALTMVSLGKSLPGTKPHLERRDLLPSEKPTEKQA